MEYFCLFSHYRLSVNSKEQGQESGKTISDSVPHSIELKFISHLSNAPTFLLYSIMQCGFTFRCDICLSVFPVSSFTVLCNVMSIHTSLYPSIWEPSVCLYAWPLPALFQLLCEFSHFLPVSPNCATCLSLMEPGETFGNPPPTIPVIHRK